MNILLVTPMPPQARAPGAIPVLLNTQITALLPNHQLTLVTVVGPDPGEEQAIRDLQARGITVYPIPLLSTGPFARWQRRWELASTWLKGAYPWRTVWFRVPQLQKTIDHLLATQTFDLIQIEDNAMGIYDYGQGTATLFTEHEVRRPRAINWHKPQGQCWREWAFNEIDWLRWRAYQKKLWTKFDCIQVFTERDAESMRAIAPEVSERIRINPFAIENSTGNISGNIMGNISGARGESEQKAETTSEEDNELLFVGNFTHPPNVDAALWLGNEIMPMLHQRYPKAHLTMVGIYPPPEVQALASAEITVTGFVPDIEPYVARAAVLLAPIRIGGGMRMKVLQGMAMGKAVITTARGAEGLTINGKPPPLLVCSDTTSFVESLLTLLTSSELRHQLGEQAQQFVAQHFSAAAYARRLDAIYAELVEKSTHRKVL